MKTASIGFTREDGDFQLLATLNNNDGLMSDSEFLNIRLNLAVALQKVIKNPIFALNREDAPDYITWK